MKQNANVEEHLRSFLSAFLKMPPTSAILQVEIHRKEMPKNNCCLALAVGIVFLANEYLRIESQELFAT